MKRSILFKVRCLLIGLLLIKGLQAQNSNSREKKGPFQRIKIGVSGAVNTNRNTLHHFWNPGKALEVFLEMPFYRGKIQSGVQRVNYRPVRNYLPDYSASYYYLQWGKDIQLLPGLTWLLAGRLGNMTMDFNLPDIYPEKDRVMESEVTVGLNTRLSQKLYGGWQIHAAGDYFMIYTRKRIRLTFLAVGISHTFVTPGWLVDILK